MTTEEEYYEFLAHHPRTLGNLDLHYPEEGLAFLHWLLPRDYALTRAYIRRTEQRLVQHRNRDLWSYELGKLAALVPFYEIDISALEALTEEEIAAQQVIVALLPRTHPGRRASWKAEVARRTRHDPVAGGALVIRLLEIESSLQYETYLLDNMLDLLRYYDPEKALVLFSLHRRTEWFEDLFANSYPCDAPLIVALLDSPVLFNGDANPRYYLGIFYRPYLALKAAIVSWPIEERTLVQEALYRLYCRINVLSQAPKGLV